MILARMRQVPAVGSLPRLLAVTGVSTGVVLLVFHLLAAIDRRTPGFPVLLGVIWLAFALWVAFGRVHVRCTPFDLSLPLSARRLWLTHLLAVLVAGALIIALTAALVLGLQWLVEEYLEFASGGDRDPVRMMLLLGVGLVLTVVVVESPKPDLAALPITRGYVVLLATTVVAVLALLLVLAVLPLAWAVVPLAAAVALAVRSYRAVPGALALVPAEPEVGVGAGGREAVAAAPSWDTFGDRPGSPYRLLLRAIHTHPKKGSASVWIILPFLAALGVAYGGLASALRGGEEIRLFWLPMGTYILLVTVGQMCRFLFPVDPLPVSRRRLFALLLAPGVLALVLGYGAGKAANAVLAPWGDLIEYRDAGSHGFVLVPSGRRKIAWDGQLPVMTSPWGESHTALGGPPFRGSRMVLYSPFSTPEGSSPEFVALQMSRAIAAIYGAEVPPAELQERYFEVRDDGKVGLKAAGFHLLDDYPHLRPRVDEGPAFPVVMALIGVPFLLLLAVVLLTLRASIADWIYHALFWPLVVLLLLSTAAPLVLEVAGLIDIGAVAGLVKILIRQAGQTVVGTLAVWGGSALLLAGAYLLAEKAFGRVEMPISVKCVAPSP